MSLFRIGVMCSLTTLLVACQMPQPRSPFPTPPAPPPSAPPSGPSGSPPPSGSPSDPSSSPPSGESGSPPSSPGGPPGQEGAPTPAGAEGAETMEGGDVEGLDEQLDEALEDFDESVAGAGSESEDAADILNPLSNSAASAATSDEPMFEEGSPGEAGESGENEAIAQRAAEGASGEAGEASQVEGEMTSSGGQGEKQAADEAIIPIPDDVGDGRDDNIVERQIREAAMKEQDEALREKLWDEYRRIKGQ